MTAGERTIGRGQSDTGYVFRLRGDEWERQLVPEAGGGAGGDVAVSADCGIIVGGNISVGNRGFVSTCVNDGETCTSDDEGSSGFEPPEPPTSTPPPNWFGRELAVSDDGSTLVVGQIGDSTSTGGIGAPFDRDLPNSGSVRAHQRIEQSWRQRGYIKAPEPGEGARFGNELALSADGERILVVDDAEPSALRVHRRDELIWSFEGELGTVDDTVMDVSMDATGGRVAVGLRSGRVLILNGR